MNSVLCGSGSSSIGSSSSRTQSPGWAVREIHDFFLELRNSGTQELRNSERDRKVLSSGVKKAEKTLCFFAFLLVLKFVLELRKQESLLFFCFSFIFNFFSRIPEAARVRRERLHFKVYRLEKIQNNGKA